MDEWAWWRGEDSRAEGLRKAPTEILLQVLAEPGGLRVQWVVEAENAGIDQCKYVKERMMDMAFQIIEKRTDSSLTDVRTSGSPFVGTTCYP